MKHLRIHLPKRSVYWWAAWAAIVTMIATIAMLIVTVVTTPVPSNSSSAIAGSPMATAQDLGITQPIPTLAPGKTRVLVLKFQGDEDIGKPVAEALKLQLENRLKLEEIHGDRCGRDRCSGRGARRGRR